MSILNDFMADVKPILSNYYLDRCCKELWHANTLHHHVLENNLDQHFPQTRRSHDRNLVKACLLTKLLFCLLRKIAYLHETKQNEKHPFINIFMCWYSDFLWPESLES